MLVYFLSFIIGAFAGASNDLFASVGVGSASVRGFSWTYDIRNPDLIDPPGKVYWVLTDDGVAMTTADIMAGNNPTQSNCFGQATQVDSDIHEQRMDCSLTAGVKYLFWVAVDYDGDGTEAVDCTVGGVPVIPQVDKDCDGVWSTCDEDCIQYYSITQYPSGDGAGCEIGDEEERVCAPGTDQCPLNGSYDTYNPKPEGFDLGLTPDPSANTAGGMWYYIVTPPNATPTPDEIQTGSGGLCGGSYAISDASQEDVQTINCNLHCQTLYDVWVAQDSNGDGTATILTPTKQVTLPCPLPVGNLFAHTPTATGHMISYDIDNPVATGKFYYKTLPLGSPNPTAAEIRDCADGVCCGSVQQTVPAPMTTLTNANCPLTPGDYVVWGEVDTDGNGADASLTNAGVAFQFTYVEPTDGPTQPAPPVTTTSTYSTNTPVSSTSQNTQPPVTAPPIGGLGRYRVVYPGQECENDQIGDGITAHIHDTIILPNVRIGYGSDVARCAGFVSQNRARNGGCSTLFHTGGITGECRCVRIGYVCDRDESEYGRTIFKLCMSTESCSMAAIFPIDVVLAQQQNALPAPPKESNNLFYLYLSLSLVGGILLGVSGYFCLRSREKEMADSYHLSLDNERTI
jgi:hypothetical protein